MPTKGTKLKTGHRLRLVTTKFFRKYLKDRNTLHDISYTTFSNIINECNESLSSKILDNTSGFKLPENMGYLAVSKYKSDKRSIDYNKSKQLGVTVYHTNFHSYGYKSRIVWYSSQITRCKFYQIYKFLPERKVSRGLGEKMKVGKIYNEYNYSHFKVKTMRIDLDKRFKK